MVWQAGEAMEYYDPITGTIDLVHAPDEVKIEVAQFNRRVVTEEFNRVICKFLAENIDPSLPVTTEDSFFSYLEGEGLQVQVKASGSSHFLSLNEGIIGKKAVGSKREVLQSFRDKGIRIKQQPLTEELDERWGERLEDSPEDEPTESRQSSEATQLELLTTAYPVMTPHALQG